MPFGKYYVSRETFRTASDTPRHGSWKLGEVVSFNDQRNPLITHHLTKAGPAVQVWKMIPRPIHDCLRPFLEELLARVLARGPKAGLGEGGLEEMVPHARLRLVMASDPALASLIPGAPGHFAMGDQTSAPFAVKRSGMILLPPVLLEHPAAMAVAARWGMSALDALRAGRLPVRRVVSVLRHGAGLLALADAASRQLVHSLMPPEVIADIEGDAAVRWLIARIDGADLADAPAGSGGEPLELERPLEQILMAGGDGRLVLNPNTGLNRYGVCPRPRPEAVHFSSSTASAVSGYGFLLADLVRRALLDAALDGAEVSALRRGLVSALGDSLMALTGLEAAHADVAITPSGTDAELVTVLLATAGAEGRPLTNVLISPEESGKGVLLAGAGKYFDDTSATGAVVKKGAAAVEGLEVQVCEIPIRDELCQVRGLSAVDEDFLQAGRAALKAGHHVLAHMLLGSKTGLIGPSEAAIEALVREAPDRVDVAVDACQLRSEFTDLGAMVRRGWIVQTSGSKFLTGPPFAGTLLVPEKFRARMDAFGALLRRAPGAGLGTDWGPVYAEKLALPGETGSFGPLLRWLPALLEARLYLQVPHRTREHALARFRAALLPRLLESVCFKALDHDLVGDRSALCGWLESLSILSFQVLGKQADGTMRALDEKQSAWLFEHLNQDVSPLIDDLSEVERVTARQPCHIGQPVVLYGAKRQLAYLRLVLGARFFNIVGHAPGGGSEAALESEISDAKRVLEKIELIASNWWRLVPAG